MHGQTKIKFAFAVRREWSQSYQSTK